MKWIGLTGGIATGKSTVTTELRSRGIPVICADEVAKLVVLPGTVAYLKILQDFGQEYLDDRGHLDRMKLGALVFKDLVERKKLEAIIHPQVHQKVQEFKRQMQDEGHEVAIYDVPLLFENNLESEFDLIICVYCSSENQLQRLMQRNQLSMNSALTRLQAQLSIETKKIKSDYIINNNINTNDHAKLISAEVDLFCDFLKINYGIKLDSAHK